jgi:hypothetical protein
MTVEPEHEDLARELHAMRAEPRPEFARELDARAAELLRERPRRRLPPLRIAIPAVATAAAAAVVVALVVAGGDDGGGAERLEVAVVAAEETPSSAGGAEAFDAPRKSDSRAPAAPLDELDSRAAAPDVLALEAGRVPADGSFVVRYQVAERTRATVELAGLAAEVTLGPGTGSIEVAAEGLPAGTHRLKIAMRGVTVLSERVQIDG